MTPREDEELIPAVPTPPYTWVTAWGQISRQCWEQGGEFAGHLAISELQDQAMPLPAGTRDPASVLLDGEAAWTALGQTVHQLESTAGILQVMDQMKQVLFACRECPSTLPQLRQGVLILAHAVLGHLYSIDDYGPSTAQEWLFPAEVIARGLPTTGHISNTWSSMALRVLATLPCPLQSVPDEPEL